MTTVMNLATVFAAFQYHRPWLIASIWAKNDFFAPLAITPGALFILPPNHFAVRVNRPPCAMLSIEPVVTVMVSELMRRRLWIWLSTSSLIWLDCERRGVPGDDGAGWSSTCSTRRLLDRRRDGMFTAIESGGGEYVSDSLKTWSLSCGDTVAARSARDGDVDP